MSSSSPCRAALPSPKTVLVPREPDEPPPAKVPRVDRVYPPDDPFFKPYPNEWTWSNAEAFCVDWQSSKMLTDETRGEDGKQACDSLAEHLELQ